MNPQEALEWAADYAERAGLFRPSVVSTGGPPDKLSISAPKIDTWTQPTLEEKFGIIIGLAKMVSEPTVITLPDDTPNEVIQKLLEEIRKGHTTILPNSAMSTSPPFAPTIAGDDDYDPWKGEEEPPF